MSGSKFAGLFPTGAATDPGAEFQTAESPEVRKSETPKVRKSRSVPAQTSESPKVQKSESPAEPASEKRMGRPPGKKSDPAFRQVTVYLSADLHEAGKERVFRSRGSVDFSELVEAALREYLAKGKA